MVPIHTRMAIRTRTPFILSPTSDLDITEGSAAGANGAQPLFTPSSCEGLAVWFCGLQTKATRPNYDRKTAQDKVPVLLAGRRPELCRYGSPRPQNFSHRPGLR